MPSEPTLRKTATFGLDQHGASSNLMDAPSTQTLQMSHVQATPQIANAHHDQDASRRK